MKTKFILPFLFFSFCLVSQSLKEGSYKFKYEVLPYFPLDKEVKTYKVNIVNGSSDNVPLDPRKLYYAEKYITDLKNITTVRAEGGGVFVGGMPKETLKVSNPDAPADLEVILEYNNIELTDKKEQVSTVQATSTTPAISYYNFKLTFNFSYRIKVKDTKKNIIILDTLVNKPRSTLFPSDYRYDALGNNLNFPGHISKPDLDLDYRNNSKDLYFYTKSALMGACLGEQKYILGNCFSYLSSMMTVCPTRVKSKDPLFDICDTTVNLIERIADSISSNSKKEKHLNWHTNSIRTMAVKLSTIWEQMLTGEKYLAAFSDPKDKELYIFRMKKNLAMAYIWQEEYAKARVLLDEVLATYNSKKTNDYLETDYVYLDGMIKREGYMYIHHKTFFNFY